MNVTKEISVLLDVLNISEKDLSEELDVSLLSINNWRNNNKQIEDININNLYNFAYSKGIKFNQIFEQLLKEENNNNNSLVLFHGAKKNFSFPIDIKSYSKDSNDFGKGFYLGESYKQASMYIANSNNNKVYAFKVGTSDLNILKFDVDNNWMLAISYFRGWLDEYKESKIIKNIIQKINEADVIIAPIADNRMFDIINEFSEGSITDKQCEHSLAATDLGYQYVVKTKKALDNLLYLRELFISTKEKGNLINQRFDLTSTGLNKVKVARIEYKGKGKYIEELLK